jgi:hypothetical protein
MRGRPHWESAMTEAQWLASESFSCMHQFIRQRASNRKLRLFACACCRCVWDLLPDVRSRNAVEVTERFADGWATKEEVSVARMLAGVALHEAIEACRPLDTIAPGFRGLSGEEKQTAEARWRIALRRREAARAAKAVARATDRASRLAEELSQAAGWAFYAAMTGTVPIHQLSLHRANLLRCIIGNPFRPVVLNPAWLSWNDRTVPKLAQSIHEEVAFDHLPILADALEESGCTNTRLLDHCRVSGPHIKGCWVIDLILGKE